MAARGDTPALGDVAPTAAGVEGATKGTSRLEAALVPYECCIWRKETIPPSRRMLFLAGYSKSLLFPAVLRR